MISPANGSTLPGASATFTWNAGTCVSNYVLYVGSSPGGRDIATTNAGTNLTATVANLPTDGRIIYVRLASVILGNQANNDYVYLAANSAGGGGGGGGCATPAAATITNPAAGSVLTGASATFQWSAGSCVSAYTLSIGTSAGATDIYSANQGTNQSVTVNSLPTNGSTLYVRLTSTINGSPQSNDYTYTAFQASNANCGSSTLAAMTSPVSGSTFSGASQTFIWAPGCNATAYFLYVGNAPGGFDLYFQSQGTGTSATASNLPTDGRNLYVRLWTLFSGSTDAINGWQFNDYTYKAFNGGANCTNGSPAAITSPGNGSTLSGSMVAFQWTSGNCVTQYTLSVGTTAGGTDIFSGNMGTNQSATVSNLPTNGSQIFVRLTSTIGGNTQSNDYTYTAFTSNGGGCGTTALATMASPVNGSTLSGASATFAWNPGCNVSQYYLYVGSAPGAFDIYFQNQGTNLTTSVSGLPVDGRTVYVRLWSLFSGAPGFADGWQYNDYTYQTGNGNAGGCGTPAPGAITSPVNGSTLGGSSTTFQWTAGACVSSFTLSVGNSVGASDIYSASQGVNTAATVNNLPVDGRALFVRLTSVINGNPQTADYTYTAFQPITGCGASTKAVLTSPTNGSTLTGASATFQWTAGCNASQYFLYIGSSPGAFDILFQNENTGLSTTFNSLPTDGRTLYVRLWTFFTGANDVANGWLSNDYTFTAFK